MTLNKYVLASQQVPLYVFFNYRWWLCVLCTKGCVPVFVGVILIWISLKQFVFVSYNYVDRRAEQVVTWKRIYWIMTSQQYNPNVNLKWDIPLNMAKNGKNGRFFVRLRLPCLDLPCFEILVTALVPTQYMLFGNVRSKKDIVCIYCINIELTQLHSVASR